MPSLTTELNNGLQIRQPATLIEEDKADFGKYILMPAEGGKQIFGEKAVPVPIGTEISITNTRVKTNLGQEYYYAIGTMYWPPKQTNITFRSPIGTSIKSSSEITLIRAVWDDTTVPETRKILKSEGATAGEK